MKFVLPLLALVATSSAQHCPEDVDGSEAVDVEDIMAVLAAFGEVCDLTVSPQYCPADFDGSGVVDVEDITTVLAAFGDVCDLYSTFACHEETCHSDGHWIEVDFGEFATLEECHNLCACHPDAISMQYNHEDGWCGCMTLEEGVQFVDAIVGEHVGDGDCTICNVETVIDASCGVDATCVYETCHSDGHWIEVGFGDYFTLEECQNHCACHPEATASQFNEPEDDEPGWCGCLILDGISFADAITGGAHIGEDNQCTICDIEFMMGHSCHEYEEPSCEDADWFEEEYGSDCETAVAAAAEGCDTDAWPDEPIGWFCENTCGWCETFGCEDADWFEAEYGMDCPTAIESVDGGCDAEAWPGEPIGWFCESSCEWCSEGECANADWFEEEYGTSCEGAVGTSGEWTDECEIEAWPGEPIWWFCPVACGEC